MSAFKISPVRVVGTIHDGVHVKVKDRTIKKFGNHRDAGHYQNGYDRALREVVAFLREKEAAACYEGMVAFAADLIEQEFGEL